LNTCKSDDDAAAADEVDYVGVCAWLALP